MRTIGSDTIQTSTVHAFEAAGLGKAPYTFTGLSVLKGPITLKDGSQVGAPGQPMGTCHFCGTGIMYAYNLRSADGKEFYVGCDCIEKSGDKGLLRVVSVVEKQKRQAQNDARRAKKAEKAKAAREEMKALMEKHRTALEALPHPSYPGKTKYDHAEFCLRYAGSFAVTVWVEALRKMEA